MARVETSTAAMNKGNTRDSTRRFGGIPKERQEAGGWVERDRGGIQADIYIYPSPSFVTSRMV